MDLNDLFEILPDIVLYIASGYLFILTFSFISLRQKMKDINGIFCASLAVGFILKMVLCAIVKIRFGYYINVVAFLIFSMAVGAFLGLFIKSKFCRNILKKINVNRSVNENMWHDIIDSDKRTMWVRVVDWEKERVIVGILVLVEEFQREPQILLQQYQVFDLEGNMIEDYIDYPNQRILIKTERFDNIDIVYDVESTHFDKIEIEEDEDV